MSVGLMDSRWERPRLLGDKGCCSNNPSRTPPGGQHNQAHVTVRDIKQVCILVLLTLFQYSYTKGKQTLLNWSNLLTSALQVNRPVRQEGVWPRRFLRVTRFAFGLRFLPAFSPLLHWGHFGWDAGTEHLLGDETISCWRGRAASTPMMQMSKTVQHFRTERTESGTTLEEVQADENQGWCTWNQGCLNDIRPHKKSPLLIFKFCSISKEKTQKSFVFEVLVSDDRPLSVKRRGCLVFVWS